MFLSRLRRYVHFDTWRLLEAILRWILVGRWHGAVAPRADDCGVLTVNAPELRFGALGHGCLDPGSIAFLTETFEPAPHDLSSSQLAKACVIGEGPIAQKVARRLVALGAQTHFAATTVEGHAAALEAGAIPHHTVDLPVLLRRLDIVICTDLTHFIDARLIAQLPEDALIVDLAGPPGSVDFEAAKGLGREIFWARRFAGSSTAETEAHLWDVIRARVEVIPMMKSAAS